jgi:DNA invertase Pin-like site-specific DNA recombinase
MSGRVVAPIWVPEGAAEFFSNVSKRPRHRGRPSPDRKVRAAQYVRMSTELQTYSTENQAAAIRDYAERNGFVLVKTYADEGKSGLDLDGRAALKALIDDVAGGRAEFEAVLVYDVSRWGRFQDPDESAYYEFICRQAGIAVHYCVEPFNNDGSLPATIIKGMKRAMAGEYSRELSAKVFAGQCRLITLGFRQGGAAGYGLRRQLVDEHRQPKAELRQGDRKSLQTDRVILVPGPAAEQQTVRRIYRMFVEERRSEQQIAAALNQERSASNHGRTWTRASVRQVLTNEKYIGNNIYNRSSFKLKQNRVVNTPDMWVRADGAFAPIVDEALFTAARQIMIERSRRFSNDDMLDRLRSLLAEVGWLSGLVIDEREDMPSAAAYQHRFGSLVQAYRLIGYSAGRDYRYIEANRFLRSLYPTLLEEVIAGVERSGASAIRDPQTDLLRINDEFTASVVIARCFQTPGGALRWKVRLDTGLKPDITVAMRMDTANRQVLDTYLLPRIDIGPARLRLGDDNGIDLDTYRFETLDAFYYLASRTSIRMAA